MKYPEYDSPFELVMSNITTQMVKEIDDMCLQAVQRVGINANKEKLLDALTQDSKRYRKAFERGYETACAVLYSRNQVATIISDLVGDDCACNVNGNDEWLPQYCEFRDTCCPNPDGVACWEQYLANLDKRDIKLDD